MKTAVSQCPSLPNRRLGKSKTFGFGSQLSGVRTQNPKPKTQNLKPFSNRKGWLRIIEIALAATLVFSFMLFLTRFESGSKESRPVSDSYLLKQRGQDALLAFDLTDSDSDGVSDMRENAVAGTFTDLSKFVASQLGPQTGYALYFYNFTSAYTDNVLFKAGATAYPINRDIVSVYYALAGASTKFCSEGSACAVKLDLWFIK